MIKYNVLINGIGTSVKTKKYYDEWSKDYDKVFERAYRNLKEVNFEGIYYRRDIGYQVRNKSSN